MGDDGTMPSFRMDFGGGNLIDLSEEDDYEFPHPIQRWVMPLMIVTYDDDDKIADATVVGTGFTIAPGLTVTAKHNLEDHFELAGSADVAELGIRLLFLTNEEFPSTPSPVGLLLHVDKVVFNPDHDLALLRFRAEQVDGRHPKWTFTPLTFDLPFKGSEVIAFGYSHSVSGFTPPDGLNLEQKVRASKGIIQDVFPEGRDSILRYSALVGNFPAPKGMSGGPVMDVSTGHVCGVVCRALGPGLDDAPDVWTSSGSLLPFLLNMDIELQLQGAVGNYSIRELADRGAIPTDGSQARFVSRDRGDGQTEFGWHKPDPPSASAPS